MKNLKEFTDRELINELIAREKVIFRKSQKTGKIRTYLIRESKIKDNEPTTF